MIRLENICKNYGEKNLSISVLKNLQLTIQEGDMIAIIGKSGSGKTTLLNILGAISVPDEGSYFYYDKETHLKNRHNRSVFRRDEVGVVTQNFALIDDLTVSENISLPLKIKKRNKSEINKKVLEVMKLFRIEDKANAYLDEISRGQQQKVAIARAIIKSPKFILADEPTGSLDAKSGQEILDILSMLNQQGSTIVLVTHDMDIAHRCKRIYELKKGELVLVENKERNDGISY